MLARALAYIIRCIIYTIIIHVYDEYIIPIIFNANLFFLIVVYNYFATFSTRSDSSPHRFPQIIFCNDDDGRLKYYYVSIISFLNRHLLEPASFLILMNVTSSPHIWNVNYLVSMNIRNWRDLEY